MNRTCSGWVLLVGVLCGLTPKGLALADDARPAPLLHAHAHNDYEHPRPLLDAIDHGFLSVEADIHLVGGELLVAHDLFQLRPDRTLEALYLSPLSERIAANQNRVQPGAADFYLLIDIKTDAEATYALLRRQLARHAKMLTTVRNGKLQAGAVTVIISGNCPRETITAENERYCAIDGRPKDLTSDAPAHLIPWISDSWHSQFQWHGEGPFPEAQQQKLKELVQQTHDGGRKLRLWAAPDNQAAWKLQLEAGVDLINTDNLAGLEQFLRSAASPKSLLR